MRPSPSPLPFFTTTPPPPTSTLFPYTTLFRSHHGTASHRLHGGELVVAHRVARHRESARCERDRKSTRLNSSHPSISYAVLCLKKKSAVRERKRRPGDRQQPYPS